MDVYILVPKHKYVFAITLAEQVATHLQEDNVNSDVIGIKRSKILFL